MMIYPFIWRCTAIWALFAVLYHFVLRRHTYFTLNRIWLWMGLLLGLILPLWQPRRPLVTITLPEQVLQSAATSDAILPVAQPFGEWSPWLYCAGAIAALVYVTWGAVQLWQQHRHTSLQAHGDYQWRTGITVVHPYSAWGQLYLPPTLTPEDPAFDAIYRHEAAHLRAYHHWDIVVMTILQVLFWFHPLLHYYRRALREVHEYAADEAVIQVSSVRTYGRLLLAQALPGVQLPTAHYFNQSQLKNRIRMMTKTRSPRTAPFQYGLSLGLVLALALLFTQQVSWAQPVHRPEVPEEEKAYTTVEQMPYIVGCETSGDGKDRTNCTHQKVVTNVVQHLQYPKTARKNGIEGVAFVQFVIDKSGEVRDIKLLEERLTGNVPDKKKAGKYKGILGDAAVAAVETMSKDESLKWVPGYQRGKPVHVQMILPLRFKLN